jgi:hypothetical protein
LSVKGDVSVNNITGGSAAWASKGDVNINIKINVR